MELRADAFPLGRRESPAPGAILGPDSVSWRLRSGGIVMSMAKARAALLQLAHPKIAAGLAEHSTFESDPYKRVRITGQTMSAILFGSSVERGEAIRLLRGLHARVNGTLAGGDTYTATDPELLWFVLATLVDSDLVVEQTLLKMLDDRDRDTYYYESMGLVEAFRIPRGLVPRDRAGLRDYVLSACSELDVGPDARRLAAKVFEPTFLRLARGPLVWGYRSIMVGLLPVHVRVGYGFETRQPVPDRLAGTTARLLLPMLPARLRQLPMKPVADETHAQRRQRTPQ